LQGNIITSVEDDLIGVINEELLRECDQSIKEKLHKLLFDDPFS
jgi:hypothetical protein